MAGIDPTNTLRPEPDLAVHAPRQQRTREQWRRILDAGVELLEQGGYEAFTIAALSQRAEVPPRALYARVATKDGLFLAVYEHGMSRVLGDHRGFAEEVRGGVGGPSEGIEKAVRFLVTLFSDHADFLRAVVLIAGAHPELRRRGEAYAQELGELFAHALVAGTSAPEGEAVDFCFSLLFATLVLRTAYGPGMGPSGGEEELCREMVTMARRYLQVA
jgi:AcrR family transcriptional regulator